MHELALPSDTLVRMSRRRLLHASWLVLVGCNALTGVSELSTSENVGGPASAPTASTPVPETDGAQASVDGGDGGGAANTTDPRDASRPVDAKPDGIVLVDAAPDVIVGPPPGAKRAFVTSITSTGNLGGFAGADGVCSTRAQAASLGGTWVAWLSNGKAGGTHAVNRVTSVGPWYLLDGTIAVADKAALAAGTLTHAIDRNELNQAVTGTAWTATAANGNYMHNACGAWRLPTQQGRFGNVGAVDAAWTSAGNGPCTASRRLYCFEL